MSPASFRYKKKTKKEVLGHFKHVIKVCPNRGHFFRKKKHKQFYGNRFRPLPCRANNKNKIKWYGRKRYQRKHNYVVISKDESAKRRAMRASVVYVSMWLHASVVYVPTCFRASVVYVPMCLHPNVPKACQILIFTCQRANKCAKVP